MRSGTSIKRALLLNSLIISIVPLFLFAFFITKLFGDQFKQELVMKNQAIADVVVNELNLFFEAPKNCLQILSFVADKHMQDDPRHIKNFIKQTVPFYPEFSSIMILDDQGRIVENYPENDDLIGMDMSNQPYFQSVTENRNFHWSEVFLTPVSAVPTVTISKSFAKGVIVGYLPITTLSEYTIALTAGTKLEAVVYDKNGIVIAHQDKKVIETRQGVGSSGNFPLVTESESFYHRNAVTDDEFYVCAHKLEETGWMLMVAQPTDLMFGAEYKLRLLILLITAMAAVIAFFFTLRSMGLVTKPLQSFTELVDQMAGETISVSKDETLPRELIPLQDSFMEMASRVKNREYQLRMSESHFRGYFELNLIGMAKVSPDGKYLEINDYICKLTGRSRDVILGTPIWEGNDAIESLREQELFSEISAGDRDNYSFTRRIVLQDNTIRHAEIALKAVYGEHGEIDHLVLIANDISKRVQAEQQLLQQQEQLEQLVRERTAELTASNRELEQFAYVASHDLQEPLRMVASYTELLEQRYKGKLDEKADKYIHYTVDGAKRMQCLINDLLHLSRVNTRGREFVVTDCNKVVDKVLRILEHPILKNQAEVQVEPLPQVIGDETQLIQLFQNLIGNAIKFHGELKPRIRVQAEKKDSAWVFSVEDNGIGIEPRFFDRVFVIFQRLHKRDEYKGTGIGLAICKKIVERHGGEIWVESETGKGTTFYFSIPESPVRKEGNG